MLCDFQIVFQVPVHFLKMGTTTPVCHSTVTNMATSARVIEEISPKSLDYLLVVLPWSCGFVSPASLSSRDRVQTADECLICWLRLNYSGVKTGVHRSNVTQKVACIHGKEDDAERCCLLPMTSHLYVLVWLSSWLMSAANRSSKDN